MTRLTDEQRNAVARLWPLARRAAAVACARYPACARDAADVESFAGEYLLRVVAAHRPDRGSDLETHVSCRLRHLATEWMRHRFRRDAHSAARAAEVTRPAAKLESATDRDCPIRAAERAEAAARVRGLLRRLNDGERRIAEPVALHGATLREAASAAGLSFGYARALWSECRKRLGA